MISPPLGNDVPDQWPCALQVRSPVHYATNARRTDLYSSVITEEYSIRQRPWWAVALGCAHGSAFARLDHRDGWSRTRRVGARPSLDLDRAEHPSPLTSRTCRRNARFQHRPGCNRPSRGGIKPAQLARIRGLRPRLTFKQETTCAVLLCSSPLSRSRQSDVVEATAATAGPRARAEPRPPWANALPAPPPPAQRRRPTRAA
jgi:hypothetical protein